MFFIYPGTIPINLAFQLIFFNLIIQPPWAFCSISQKPMPNNARLHVASYHPL